MESLLSRGDLLAGEFIFRGFTACHITLCQEFMRSFLLM